VIPFSRVVQERNGHFAKFRSSQAGRGRSEALARGLDSVVCETRLLSFGTPQNEWPGTATPVRCGVKRKQKNGQKIKGTFTDAICSGVHVTPLHRASENGRLKLVLVLIAQGILSLQ
jgi:hypothetical protein